jgi:hypothetical protein
LADSVLRPGRMWKRILKEVVERKERAKRGKANPPKKKKPKAMEKVPSIKAEDEKRRI